MITRTQFRAFAARQGLAIQMFSDALDRHFDQPGAAEQLYITIEVRPQYELLRRKLAKRAAKKRRAAT